MSSLTDPPLAAFLERLHREADGQRDRIRTELSTSDDRPREPTFRWQRLKDFHLPVSRDALATLAGPGGPVDLVLLDGGTEYAVRTG